MKEKLNELKLKCNNILDYNRQLRNLTLKIMSPTIKTLWKFSFWIGFFVILVTLIFHYIFYTYSPNYNIVQRLFGVFITSILYSLLLSVILLIPGYLFLKFRREALFIKIKPEIEILLNKINSEIRFFADFPEIPYKYLNEFYLEEIIYNLENGSIDLNEAIKKFEIAKLNDKTFERKRNTANIRYNVLDNLIQLSNKKDATDSLKKWVDNYNMNSSKKNESSEIPNQY